MTPERPIDPALPFLAYPLAVDLANSIGARHAGSDTADDLLADVDGLGRWLSAESHALADLGGPADVDLGPLRELRGHVVRLLRAAAAGAPLPQDAIRAVNAASAGAPVHPELMDGPAPAARHASHAPGWQAELHGRVARSAIDVLTGPDADRLSRCEATSCGLLFVASRHGQRWCSGSCGNRARVARHYHRRRRRAVRLP